MAASNRRWNLVNRPTGQPRAENFAFVETSVPEPADGQVVVRTLYLSVDPYMRGRMRPTAGYTAPVELGEVMVGGTVGRVVASRYDAIAEGDIVEGMAGWQDYAALDGRSVRRVDPELAPISTALGVLGMPGLTAYFGLLEVGQARAGDVVFVSGGAGAVGSLVGQIAKLTGCRAVGSAGSDEKVAFMTDALGFDGAFNYKTVGDDLGVALKAHCPDGIDVYFDNVGGPITDAVFPRMRNFGRIAVCGQIALYNAETLPVGPRKLMLFISKRLRAEGFLVFDYAKRYDEGLRALAGWVRDGSLRYRETIVDGLENAPAAFLGMMQGANIGKQLVKVAD